MPRLQRFFVSLSIMLSVGAVSEADIEAALPRLQKALESLS